MIESKSKNVSIFVTRTKIAGDVAVCVSINLKVNGCCLNKLKSGWCCNSHPAGEEVACTAYSTYLNVNNLLCGDPVAMKSTKVGSTKCGAHNGNFFISWKVKGTLSAVRKSIGIALKGLVPGKLYSTYTQVMRGIGSTPKRETFNWAAQEVLSSIKAGVHCGVVGNINLGKTTPEQKKKVDSLIETASKKLSPGDVKLPKKKPEGTDSCTHGNNVTTIKVNGWAAYVVKDYIMSKARGVAPLICDKEIIIPVKESSWKSMSEKLNKSASDHVKARYAKVGNELGPVMSYLAIASGSVSCVDIKPLLRGPITAAQVTSAIKSVL
jgi:hypothetical protein